MARLSIRFSTLLVILSVLSLVLSLAPRPIGGTPTTLEERTDNDATSGKQTNRKKILSRMAIKYAAEIVPAVKKVNKPAGGVWAWGGESSSWGSTTTQKPYPKCKHGKCDYPRLARYPGWELYHDTLQVTKADTEEKCLELCYKADHHKHGTPLNLKTACVGIEWIPKNTHNCELKGLKVSKGKFTHKSKNAEKKGTELALIGGCSFWSHYIPKAMDKVCCETH